MGITKKNSVLFVDDEVNVLKSIKRGLRKEVYKQYFATSAEKGLEMISLYKIDVLVTDMRMPGMNGLEFMKEVNEVAPEIIKVVLSGYTQLPQILATINQVNIFKFIAKPWELETELKVVVEAAIEQSNLKKEHKELQEEIEQKNRLYQKLIKKNDERIQLMKYDFKNISRINYITRKFLIDEVSKFIPSEIIKQIDKKNSEVSKGLDLYSAALPTVLKEFKINDVFKLIEKYRRENQIEAEVNFNVKNNRYVYGNIKLIYIVFIYIFENFYLRMEAEHINVGVTYNKRVSDDNESEEFGDLVFIINSNISVKILKNEIEDHFILDFFIDQLNGSIEFRDEDYSDFLMIKIPIENR